MVFNVPYVIEIGTTIHKNSNNQLLHFELSLAIIFSKRMKKVLLIYAVLIISIIAWYLTEGKGKRIINDAKGIALKVSKHSQQFNESIETVMKYYYDMVDNFTKGDTTSIDKDANQLKIALEGLKIDELKKDSSIYETAAAIWENTKTEITGMLGDASLDAKRESLNLFSNELFTLLLTVHYDLTQLYWQECSSAFGDDTPGNWISASRQSVNPYGKSDCATVKKVIDFVPADSTKR